MSKRTTIKLLILAVICVTAALFAGCSGELKANDFLQQNNALNQRVTYYSNGGYFDNKSSVVEKNIYYHVGDVVLTNFDNVQGKSISRRDYVFDGWFYTELTDKLDKEGNPELDGQGNRIQVPVFEDEEKKIVKIDENRPLDPNLKLKENDALYVGARWKKDIQLRYVLAGEDITVKVDGEDKVIRVGEELTTQNFFNGLASVKTDAPVASTDSSFIQCYLDEACTVLAEGTVTKPSFDDVDAQQKATVYAKYLKGKWTAVKTKNDVGRMFASINSTDKYFIVNDIDCTGQSFNPMPANYYSNCYIEGNNKTLSNLTFAYAQGSGMEAGGVYSIFGTFGATAEIKNLTLENVTLDYTTRVNVGGLYFFSNGDEGAKFENFVIRNAVMNVDTTGTVPNIQKIGDKYQDGHWLFGSAESDAAFSKAGFTIDGKKLTVQGEEVVNEPAATT